jgi:hypothetical protein
VESRAGPAEAAFGAARADLDDLRTAAGAEAAAMIDGARRAQPATAIMTPARLRQVYLYVLKTHLHPATSQARRGP